MAFSPITPTWADGPSGNTDIDSVDLQQFTDTLLLLNAATIRMRWDGTTYQPAALLSDTTRPRDFVGPADPAGVSGVVLSTNQGQDTWTQYT